MHTEDHYIEHGAEVCSTGATSAAYYCLCILAACLHLQCTLVLSTDFFRACSTACLAFPSSTAGTPSCESNDAKAEADVLAACDGSILIAAFAAEVVIGITSTRACTISRLDSPASKACTGTIKGVKGLQAKVIDPAEDNRWLEGDYEWTKYLL